MSTDKLIELYFGFGFVTIPLTIYYTYVIITELLDLIFNSGRIDKRLRHSDEIDISDLENRHIANKQIQSKLSESDIIELKRQMDYLKLQDKNARFKNPEKEKITNAKRLSDIFKLKEA